MPGPLEPCTSCGENTAIGTPFYSDRRILDPHGPRRRFVCALCVQGAAQKGGGRRRRPMTEDERRELERSAAAFGGFAPGGH